MTQLEFMAATVEQGYVSAIHDGHPDGPNYQMTIEGYRLYQVLRQFVDRADFDDALTSALRVQS